MTVELYLWCWACGFCAIDDTRWSSYSVFCWKNLADRQNFLFRQCNQSSNYKLELFCSFSRLWFPPSLASTRSKIIPEEWPVWEIFWILERDSNEPFLFPWNQMKSRRSFCPIFLILLLAESSFIKELCCSPWCIIIERASSARIRIYGPVRLSAFGPKTFSATKS